MKSTLEILYEIRDKLINIEKYIKDAENKVKESTY